MVLPIIGAAAVFVAVLAVVLAITNRAPARGAERRLKELEKRSDERQVENVLRTDSGTFPFMRRLLSGSGWSSTAALQLQQAGWSLKVSEYLLIRAFVAAACAGAAALLSGGSSLMILIGLGAGAVGFMLPAWFLQFRRNRRVAAINAQLAETLTLISNSLRSGFAFTQAVELAAKQVGPPVRDELLHFLRDVSLGAPTSVALEDMATRSASYDLEMMVATILVQRTTGGNLSEILDSVAETIRERERITREIRALTASAHGANPVHISNLPGAHLRPFGAELDGGPLGDGVRASVAWDRPGPSGHRHPHHSQNLETRDIGGDDVSTAAWCRLRIRSSCGAARLAGRHRQKSGGSPADEACPSQPSHTPGGAVWG